MRPAVCTRIPISKNGLSVCLNSRHIKLNAKGETLMTPVLQTAVGLAIPFVGTAPVALSGIYDLPVCGYARPVRYAHSIV